MTKKSRYLSWILRHGGRAEGLPLDEAGWVNVDELLRVAGMSGPELELIVNTNNKNRFQLENDRIRACQGHSLGSGVTLDALEASWLEYTGEGPIWHGTTTAAVEQIAGQGILPIARTHVHCAPSRDSVVGKRADVHVLLEISTARVRQAGIRIYASQNGVILARRIPPEAIVGIAPQTKGAKKRESEMRALLGLEPNRPIMPEASQRTGESRTSIEHPMLQDPPASPSDQPR